MTKALALDIGGTKVAWAVVAEDGSIEKKGSEPTPHEQAHLLKLLEDIIRTQKDVAAVGIGVAGTVTKERDRVLIATNIPELNGFELKRYLEELCQLPVALDNDGRAALIGEAWLGAAQDTSSAVLITIGTGVGGAVMQKTKILPHPDDVSQEISRLVADPSDLFPATSGKGSVESLIGGKNLEARFGAPLAELSRDARKGDEDAKEIWQTISYYFSMAVRAIDDAYRPKMLIVGGKGMNDLSLYMQDETPMPVVPAMLGEEAGLVGAGRLALDLAEQIKENEDKDWDE